VSWATTGFDDSGWQVVSTPHDFVLAGTYVNDPAEHMHGCLPRNGTGWYRKHFGLPAGWSGDGGVTWLHFEGVFHVAEVWINGKFVQRHAVGSYLGFDVSLDVADGPLRFGAASRAQPNVIALRVDASFGSGHWYEGGGITRKVHLMHTASSLRFATYGVYAVTAKSRVVAGSGTALVAPSAEVLNGGSANASVMVRYALFNRTTGEEVAVERTVATAVPTAAERPTLVQSSAPLTVTAPRLWSIKDPALYTMVVELWVLGSGGQPTSPPVDSMNITVGLREIDWHAPGGVSEARSVCI
jgi:beta-galactosidase